MIRNIRLKINLPFSIYSIGFFIWIHLICLSFFHLNPFISLYFQMQETKCVVRLGVRIYPLPCHSLLSLYLRQIRGLSSFLSFSFQIICIQEFRVWDSDKTPMVQVFGIFHFSFAVVLQRTLAKSFSAEYRTHAINFCETNWYLGGKGMSNCGPNLALNLGNICKPETQPFFSPNLIYDYLLGDCANGYVVTNCVPFLWAENLSVWGIGTYLYHI